METRIVNNIPEWRYQAAVIARLHALEDDGYPLTCAGDMNRAKRSRRERMEAKVTGLTAGEPDVRVYVTGGVLLSIELKTPKGCIDIPDREQRQSADRASSHEEASAAANARRAARERDD